MGSNALDEIVAEACEAVYRGEGNKGIEKAVKKAFKLSKNKQKKVNDNPYHIDHKRQTKLEL